MSRYGLGVCILPQRKEMVKHRFYDWKFNLNCNKLWLSVWTNSFRGKRAGVAWRGQHILRHMPLSGVVVGSSTGLSTPYCTAASTFPNMWVYRLDCLQTKFWLSSFNVFLNRFQWTYQLNCNSKIVFHIVGIISERNDRYEKGIIKFLSNSRP